MHIVNLIYAYGGIGWQADPAVPQAAGEDKKGEGKAELDKS